MVRLLIFLAALALAAGGLTWLANNPGVVDVTWRGEQYEVSLMFALGAVLALAIAIAIVWGVLRFVFRIPSLVSVGAQARRREKGFQALSRGMLAVGAGDARAAAKHASDANRLIGHEPMTKLLQAQSAQLAGDTRGRGRGLQCDARASRDAWPWPARPASRGAARRRSCGGAAICDARQCARSRGLGRSGGPRRPHATRRLGRRARDRRLERRRPPHRQADREPLARGDQDGDGRGSDGARSRKARSSSRRRPASSRRRSCLRRRSAAG